MTAAGQKVGIFELIRTKPDHDLVTIVFHRNKLKR